MELRHLKYFIKVAEMRNFSEAARVLNITQSTLSQQIRQLEGELGVDLLSRSTHSVSLTDYGTAFMPYAKKTINDADSCVSRIKDVQELNTGELRIGITYTFAPILNETLLPFMKQYPGVKVNVISRSVKELMDLLEKQEIDIALSYKPTRSYPNIESHNLFENQLSAIVSDIHPLAKRSSIRWAELEAYPMALPSTGLQARNAFDRIMEGLDYQFDIRVEIDDVGVLLNLVHNSQFVTLLSQATVHRHQGLVAIPINQKGCEMEGSFHISRDAYVKRTTKEFMRILCENKTFGMAIMDII
ncbi:MAG: LysR substrate-binding domain-containing protein [Bacteroidales bacterium]|nr:LysR substrate-binding domain-containing protein [Bacteroidales bacterium]